MIYGFTKECTFLLQGMVLRRLAGRTSEGICVHLFPSYEMESLEEFPVLNRLPSFQAVELRILNGFCSCISGQLIFTTNDKLYWPEKQSIDLECTEPRSRFQLASTALPPTFRLRLTFFKRSASWEFHYMDKLDIRFCPGERPQAAEFFVKFRQT